MEAITDIQSKMNKLCDFMMLNNRNIDDLSSFSSSNSSLAQPLPNQSATSKITLMPPDSFYFRDSISEMPLELALTKYLTENWVPIDMKTFKKKQREIICAVKGCLTLWLQV